MTKTQLVLSRVLTKVKLDKPVIDVIGPQWAIALHHVKSDKVWLMRTRTPLAIIERMKDVGRGLQSAIDKLPKALRVLINASADKTIDVYVGKGSAFATSYIWAELALQKTLLPLIKNNGSAKYSVWMIVHSESGHYKVYRTSVDDPKPNDVLRDFLNQLKRCNDEDSIIGERSRKFVEKYPNASNDMMNFTIQIVGRVSNLRKANVLMNDKIRDYGYLKCLNMTGVGRSAKLS